MRGVGALMTHGVFAVSLALSHPVRGQGFGLVGGASFHDPAIAEGESFPVDGVWALTGGASFSMGLGETRSSLRVEALVSKKSYSSPELVTDTPVETLWLDVPLLAELSLFRGSPLDPTLYGGAQASFRIRARRAFRGEDFDVSDEIKDTDFGLVLGGRVAPLSRVSLEARLEWGLRNIDDTNWYQIHTRVLRFLVGYRF